MHYYHFVPLLFWVLIVHGTSQISRRHDNIVDCLAISGVPQEFPGTDNFTQSIIPYNLRLNFTPVALAVPSTVPQVQAAVLCAAELGVKVNPRSGGHSYASHSIGGEDGHLVVDLRLFRETTVDPDSNIATIGPGARLGNVALDLFAQGGRALAFGLCPG
jgi:FAD/FMN-containing dehydrogenase